MNTLQLAVMGHIPRRVLWLVFYFGIKWDIVWSVVKNNIPELKEKIEAIIEEIEKWD